MGRGGWVGGGAAVVCMCTPMLPERCSNICRRGRCDGAANVKSYRAVPSTTVHLTSRRSLPSPFSPVTYDPLRAPC